MARHLITDDQVTKVQSQKVQQSLARVLGFSRNHSVQKPSNPLIQAFSHHYAQKVSSSGLEANVWWRPWIQSINCFLFFVIARNVFHGAVYKSFKSKVVTANLSLAFGPVLQQNQWVSLSNLGHKCQIKTGMWFSHPFRDCRINKLLSPRHVSVRPSRHLIPPVCKMTRIVGLRSWFEYGFLLSAKILPMHRPFCSCSIARNQSSHWYWWSICAAACPASWDISTPRWLHGNFFVPFLHIPSSLDRLDKALIEKPMLIQVESFCTSNLSSSTRLRDSSGGVNLLDDNCFGRLALCLINFICSDHVWNPSYWLQEYQG